MDNPSFQGPPALSLHVSGPVWEAAQHIIRRIRTILPNTIEQNPHVIEFDGEPVVMMGDRTWMTVDDALFGRTDDGRITMIWGDGTVEYLTDADIPPPRR